MMDTNMLLFPVIFPAIVAVIVLLLGRTPRMAGVVFALGTIVQFLITTSLLLSSGTGAQLVVPCATYGFDLSMRLYPFSGFIVGAIGFFGMLLGIYTTFFLNGAQKPHRFYFYFLMTVSFACGAVLADNLLIMLFFWEGLLGTLFGFIMTGTHNSFRTAIKAFVINGVTDLCLMVGIGITVYLAGTSAMSQIKVQPEGLAALGFVLMMIGAIGKGGSMPFHSWIPDAAVDAPLPFMSLLPGCLEKLLGIYLLTRIAVDWYPIGHGWLSVLVMAIGAITILLAVLMALVQKDYKRLLSFHAISQVGYMILGIGTGTPAGIVGGIFHMINNALYKSCLFLTGGMVEKQAGTTDLNKLGGLRHKMPLTFWIFVIVAASISGVPPFNGFFSKELIYDGALERGTIFYLAAVVGSFFTAASFLKLGHAAFLGKEGSDSGKAKEASWGMWLPAAILAGVCIVFGLWNALPLQSLIEPGLPSGALEGQHFGGFHVNPMLVGGTIVVLVLAILNHMYGVKKTGKGLGAVDHIHYAPVAHQLYDQAEARRLDPYEAFLKLVQGLARVGWWIDRGIDWVYDVFIVRVAYGVTATVRVMHNGSHVMYLAWSLVGLIVALWMMMG